MGPYRDDDVYYFEDKQSPFQEMEEEYESGDMFQTLLFGAILGVILLFLLSLCWSKCAADDACTDTGQNNKNGTVIAQEIKPGILVIQGGTNEETMRIIQEYEALRAQSQGSMPVPYNYGSHRTMAHFQQQPAPHPHQHHGLPPHHSAGASSSSSPSAAAVAPDPFQLIDFDAASTPMVRPPPYAPHE